MDSQGAGEQQGRPQPVYDIRNGGHYGKLPLQASLAREHRILTYHDRRECSSMLPFVLIFCDTADYTLLSFRRKDTRQLLNCILALGQTLVFERT